eukprot:1134704-Rhodomonas_salina.1
MPRTRTPYAAARRCYAMPGIGLAYGSTTMCLQTCYTVSSSTLSKGGTGVQFVALALLSTLFSTSSQYYKVRDPAVDARMAVLTNAYGGTLTNACGGTDAREWQD